MQTTTKKLTDLFKIINIYIICNLLKLSYLPFH